MSAGCDSGRGGVWYRVFTKAVREGGVRVSRLRYGSEGAGVGSSVYTEIHFENNKQDGRSVLAGRSSVARWAGPVLPVLMFTSSLVHWGTRRNESEARSRLSMLCLARCLSPSLSSFVPSPPSHGSLHPSHGQSTPFPHSFLP